MCYMYVFFCVCVHSLCFVFLYAHIVCYLLIQLINSIYPISYAFPTPFREHQLEDTGCTVFLSLKYMETGELHDPSRPAPDACVSSSQRYDISRDYRFRPLSGTSYLRN